MASDAVLFSEHPLTQARVETKSKDIKNDDQNNKRWVGNLLASGVKTDRQSIIVPINIFSIQPMADPKVSH